MFVFRSPDLVIRGVLWFERLTSLPHTPVFQKSESIRTV